LPRNKVKDTDISIIKDSDQSINEDLNLKEKTSEIHDEKQKILDEIKALNEDKKEIRQLQEPEEPIKKVKPKFKIKESPKAEDKISSTITEEQLNMLTYTITQGFCAWTDREDMSLNETAPFSKVLFDIGMQQGWFKNMEFLPYLVLIGAGFDLSMKVAKKPKKHTTSQQRIVESVVEDKIQHEPSTTLTNAELGKVDLVDQDLLVKKLGGGRLYKNQGVGEE
jgi:hypothetical protein